MARYFTLEDAAKDGYLFSHKQDEHKFVITKDAEEFGVAHYQLLGDEGIDFNSTFVAPSMRGTGLSKLLAEMAVGDDIVKGRTVHASCWFIDEFLDKHPEVLAEGANRSSF